MDIRSLRKINSFSNLKNALRYFLFLIGRKTYVKFGSKSISINVAELFFQEHNGHTFNRYDMIVRYLAVENYYNKNDFGFDWYERMQTGRISKEFAHEAVTIFKELIKSYESGYDKRSQIQLDKELRLVDGSHRMALALYHGQQKINASVEVVDDKCFYGIEWFKINGFSEKECEILKNKYEEIRAKVCVPFVCTLWDPVTLYYDEITEELKYFGKVVQVIDLDLSESEYKFYVRNIYGVDDIEKWKIEKKLEHMINNAHDCYHIRFVFLQLDSPSFRLKYINDQTLSRTCEEIKSIIRRAYQNKVNNYFFDIIMHIGDNYYQNSFIGRLANISPLNLYEILSHINNYNYALTKVDVPYMPSDFPLHYPLGKDLDIICGDEQNYGYIVSSISKDILTYKDYYDIRILKDTTGDGKEYRTRFRLEIGTTLIFQFDITYKLCNVKKDINIENYRIKKDNYYILDKKAELLIRLQEIYEHPEKEHHKEFVKRNHSFISLELCEDYLAFNWKGVLSNIR